MNFGVGAGTRGTPMADLAKEVPPPTLRVAVVKESARVIRSSGYSNRSAAATEVDRRVPS